MTTRKIAGKRTSKAKATVEKIAPEAKMFELRSAQITAGSNAEQASRAYIKGMNVRFGRQWVEFDATKASEVGDNLKATMEAYKAEKAAYYAQFRSNHAALGKITEANPSQYWGNLKKMARKENAPGDAPGKGKPLPALAAAKRDVPGLYVRVSNVDDFGTNMVAQKVARHLHAALKLILTDQELIDLADKIGASEND